METQIINLLGGPGIGKSTIAAGIFYEMKRRGILCEFVPEYAKEKVWEEAFNTMNDELYIFAKQRHKLWRLDGKVKYIIVDSPLINSIIYDNEHSELFKTLVLTEFNKFVNKTYVIKRSTTYETAGRIQTEDDAKALDEQFITLLKNNNIPYTELGKENAVFEILKDLGIE